MKMLKHIYELKNTAETLGITFGNFDGVHKGHRDIIGNITSDCRAKKQKLLVVTFTPHPNQVLGGRENFLIFSHQKRKQILASMGVDYLLELQFDLELAKLSAEDFLNQYIFITSVSDNIKTLYLGHDFALGCNKAGDIDFINHYCKNKHAELITHKPFYFDNELVSSTLVRKHIQMGNFCKVRELLEQDFYLSGSVIKGKMRGRQLGFPTANLKLSKSLVCPGMGVYATRVVIGNQSFGAITNVGYNPTFESLKVKSVETYIFNFDEEIYDQKIQLQFIKKIRDEKKFVDGQKLAQQIKMDIKVAHEVLGI
ncbi:MAG: bifunctional riboflavin kinase/FAD synthetase [Bacteriovoracaceae bacterium]|nr:bifunctional riboflavin kinase/FAD synthetase [Bacteriovoracaceae bacterium]